MNHPLRIAVADDEPDMRDYFRRCLARLGHQVVAVAENGRDLVAQLSRNPAATWSSPTSACPTWTASMQPAQIYREQPVPVILVSAFHDPELIERAEADHILGYLVKPIKQADLEPVIALTMRRFEQFEALRREAADLRQALEDRKTIDRAKSILMKRGPFDEPEAFRRLQHLASEKSRKLVEIAQMILIAEEAVQAG